MKIPVGSFTLLQVISILPLGNTEIQLTSGAGKLEKDNLFTPIRSNNINMCFNGLMM